MEWLSNNSTLNVGNSIIQGAEKQGIVPVTYETKANHKIRHRFKVGEYLIVTYLALCIPTPAKLSETSRAPFNFAKRITEWENLPLVSSWSRTGLDIQGETLEGGSSRGGTGFINLKRAAGCQKN